jgi:hypothetical protein
MFLPANTAANTNSGLMIAAILESLALILEAFTTPSLKVTRGQLLPPDPIDDVVATHGSLWFVSETFIQGLEQRP